MNGLAFVHFTELISDTMIHGESNINQTRRLEKHRNNNKRYHADVTVRTPKKIIIAKKYVPDLRRINTERVSGQIDRAESVSPLLLHS